MTSTENCQTIILKNDLAELRRFGRFLTGFGERAGLPDSFLQDVRLAFEEVFSNIVLYSYADEALHQIEIRFRMQENCLVLEIRDDGRPFDPLQVPRPDLDKPFIEREVGGMGIHLACSLMDQVAYHSDAGINVLTMTKSFSRGEDGSVSN